MRLRACLVGVLALFARFGVAQDPGWRIAPSSIELSDLLDACSALLGVSIEYQPAEVSGQVAVRINGGMSDDEVWQLAQQALTSKGLTSVQQPGSRVLQVVTIVNAPALARLEDPALVGTRAGFVKVLVPLKKSCCARR